ncbi:hypothetical protein LSG31_00560 [Fodinisporobacter ferrooxydans]|uniref:Uncharacterized protein n=1 Tax=Fodinisporobacter ferrooxydans TaxID=2901836 RepID=A0ABY4CSG3_9BACL|nr:hypothetical protein LSG31_00560 [Alicyclobacillaceae bacterium MYW30-H2]
MLTAREKAVGILGAKKLRELEEARLLVVDALEIETKDAWIAYLEARLKKEGERIDTTGNIRSYQQRT